MHCLIYHENVGNSGRTILHWCLESIKTHSPTALIKLLTNHDCTVGSAHEFVMVYQHHSGNPDHFECACIARWFAYYDYCQAHGIKDFFTCDSDVLVFCDLDHAANAYRQFDLTVSKGSEEYRGQCWSVGEMFIFNLDALKEFLKFVLWIYWHPDSHYSKHLFASGSVNDMVLWTEFLRQDGRFRFADTSSGKPGMAFDHHLCVIDDWDNDGTSKKLRWENHQPHCFNTTLNRDVRLLSLHCWGPWKTRMQELWERSRQ